MTDPEVGKTLSEPESLTPLPDLPDEHFTSRLQFRIGRKRYELRIAIEAREISTGPAHVIEMRPSAKRAKQ